MPSIDITQYNIHKPPSSFVKFTRKKHIQDDYDKFMSLLKKYNILIEDYIKQEIIKDNLYKLCLNDFPYDIPNYTHYLLWISPDIKIKIPYYIINYYLNSKFSNYICFENHIKNKSVLGIRHFHIFVPTK